MSVYLQEFALSDCNAHANWEEYSIPLIFSSQQGNGCYCLTIAFAMVMNAALFNPTLFLPCLLQPKLYLGSLHKPGADPLNKQQRQAVAD